MNSNITIIDFDDSFTHNIQIELHRMGHTAHVFEHKNLDRLVKDLSLSSSRQAVILGPGPGHPSDYSYCFDSIKSLLKLKNVYTMGICLGHQLIWKAFGHFVVEDRPVHGQNFALKIPKWRDVFETGQWGREVLVQRYNSLAVVINEKMPIPAKEVLYLNFFDNNDFNDVIGQRQMMMSYGDGFISYQFHPESIGTNCRDLFFMPLQRFLYNPLYDRPTQQQFGQLA